MKSLIFSRCSTLSSIALRSSAAATASRTLDPGCRGLDVVWALRSSVEVVLVQVSYHRVGDRTRRQAARRRASSSRRRVEETSTGGCRAEGPRRSSAQRGQLGGGRPASSGPSPDAPAPPAAPAGNLPEAHPVVEVGEGVAADQQVELGRRHLRGGSAPASRPYRPGGRASARAARRRAPPRRAAPAPPWHSGRSGGASARPGLCGGRAVGR